MAAFPIAVPPGPAGGAWLALRLRQAVAAAAPPFAADGTESLDPWAAGEAPGKPLSRPPPL